ncbi:MAG: hypothetical protein AB7Q42_07970 [Acidimicrobiia bacterium]
MRTGSKLGAFGFALAAIFVAALFVGRSAGPIDVGSASGGEHSSMPVASDDVRGLAVADGGLRLELADDVLPADEPAQFEFRILDEVGDPVTAFDELHERNLHLVVLSRNLVDYRHLHPTMDGSGSWTIQLPALAPGSYRVFADFQAAGHEPLTLGADLVVPGSVEAPVVPPPVRSYDADGYHVTLTGHTLVGESTISFAVTKDGEAVRTEPYLGAAGHLVAIRTGDLAFLHVHPLHGDDGDTDITFAAEFPSAGTYRLFLDFAHDGDVRTASFTVDVAAEPAMEGGGH